MDEWLLERAKQLAEIEERLSRALSAASLADERGRLTDLHQDVRDMLRRAEEEYRSF